MLSPLVSWILPTSSSSSTSSDGEEPVVDTDDGDYENHNDGDQESPSTSCADTTIPLGLAVPDASPAVTLVFPATNPNNDTGTNTTPMVTRSKRHRINSGTGRQYQRLWTKQDEMELLKGYLDHIRQHRCASTSLQNDVAFFYDHIRPKLNMGFNKNQLVEKLRRLKRKYKNALDRIRSGKEVSFKNPQEQAIFQISRKIWSKNRDQDALDDDIDESSPNCDFQDFGDVKVKTEEVDGDEMENRVPRPMKRPRLITGDSPHLNDGVAPTGENNGNTSIQGFIEETMRSCLSPLLKELLNKALEEAVGALNPMLLSSEESSIMNSRSEEVGDEKWRKQKILELEVYLKRLELLQDQIKDRLERLRSS